MAMAISYKWLFQWDYKFYKWGYQWIGLREHLNRKPSLFSHEDHGGLRLKFSLKPIH
jgi:hypothetical protein